VKKGGRGFGGAPTSVPQGWKALSAAPSASTADPLAAALAKGTDFLRQGRVREAQEQFQRILAVDPRHAEANHGMGLLAQQVGNFEQAVTLIGRAIAVAPRRAAFHANFGAALLALGRAAEAVDSCRRAVKLEPNSPRLQSLLGAALLAAGRPEEAAQAQRRALAQAPALAIAHAQLGRALSALGRHPEAIASLEKAVTLAPDDLDAHVWLGDAQRRRGATDDAIDRYRAVITAKPDHAAAHFGLAEALAGLGRHQGAADNFRAAIYISPSAAGYAGLARMLVALGQPQEAIDAFRMAATMAPEDVAVADELSALLVSVGQDSGAVAVAANPAARPLSGLEEEEARYRMAVAVTPDNPIAHANLASTLGSLGRLREAAEHYRAAVRLKPDHFTAWSDLLFCLNYLGDLPPADMAAEARSFGVAVARAVPVRTRHANDPDPHRRLRLGLVSGDLRQHTVGRFLEAVLAELDRDQLELFAYSVGAEEDQTTERLRASVPNWRRVAAFDDAQLDAAIVADRIDILIDLAGHTANNRLLVFARKPAPVAFTWLGYFATTGLTSIDHVLANRWVIPEAEESQWVEKPWRLPDTYLCFTPPKLAVPLAPPPAVGNGHVTFGSFNNLNKLSDPTLATWSAVLAAVPGSRLLLRSAPLADAAVRAETEARFAAHGIAAERLTLRGAHAHYATHLSQYNLIDIALDPFPYAGGTTSVEALWMGVPVLTLRGDRYVAHMGENILHNVGLPDWIAADGAGYVAKAAAFAADLGQLTTLRQSLRHRLVTSPLCDAPAFARHFEAALRGMWAAWCAAQAAI
jgi:protein O-GlcNAc transferase